MYKKCGSVDTLDFTPAPALPPRRPPWQPAAPAILGSISNSSLPSGIAISNFAGNAIGGAGSRTSVSSSASFVGQDLVDCASSSLIGGLDRRFVLDRPGGAVDLVQKQQQTPVLSPPAYPAPPRPPSRNGELSLLIFYYFCLLF